METIAVALPSGADTGDFDAVNADAEDLCQSLLK